MSTSATVNAGLTATVVYRIGTVNGGMFIEFANYQRGLGAGAGQPVSNTFTGLTPGQQYTVKVNIGFSNGTSITHTDRTITP